MIFIGFSGSREAGPQDEWLAKAFVKRFTGNVFVTGGCVGFDAQVAKEAFEAGEEVLTIIPSKLTLVDPWVYTRCTRFERMTEDTSYKDRNQRIVDIAAMLIAVPESDEQTSKRSGTWQTIRMAQRKGIPVEVYTLELARKAS